MAGSQSDNDKRQPLWRHGGYNTTAPLYQWTKRMITARKQMLKTIPAAAVDSVQQLHSEDSFLSFTRGGAEKLQKSYADGRANGNDDGSGGGSAGAVVVVAATTDPKTKHPVTGQTAITVQTGFQAGVKLCDALMMPPAGLPSPGRALLSGVDEIKYTPPVSRCGATLATLCGAAQRKGQVECGVCLGEHETRLQSMNCTVPAPANIYVTPLRFKLG
eukprot:COSAG06_NODE_14660_length_1137_cov_1.971098_2_plen_216_part_01